MELRRNPSPWPKTTMKKINAFTDALQPIDREKERKDDSRETRRMKELADLSMTMDGLFPPSRKEIIPKVFRGGTASKS